MIRYLDTEKLKEEKPVVKIQQFRCTAKQIVQKHYVHILLSYFLLLIICIFQKKKHIFAIISIIVMNVKFRMPKLWGEKKYTGTLKELVLTTIATSISIILTFGTSAWLNQRETEQARRMLAMTIINDIDRSLDVVRKRMAAEERGHGIACYVIENKDRLESIGEDTLSMFINYVTFTSFDSNMEFKTMNETILNSSQDSWRTLNDRKFLNNVQEFYNARAVLEQQSKDWVYFQKPITKEEEYDMFMSGRFESTADMCRWLLECRPGRQQKRDSL